MIHVKTGPTTTEHQAPEIEAALTGVAHLQVYAVAADTKLNLLDQRIQKVLAALDGAPRIEFTIGPVSEQ
jgi:hypothetical protein